MREERRACGYDLRIWRNRHEPGKVRLTRWPHRSRLGIFGPMNEHKTGTLLESRSSIVCPRGVMRHGQSVHDPAPKPPWDEKGDRGAGTPVGCDHAPHMG